MKRDKQSGHLMWPFAFIAIIALLVAGGEALAQQLTRFLADVLVDAIELVVSLIGAIFGAG